MTQPFKELIVLMFTLAFTVIGPCAVGHAGPYEFPVRPGSDEWRSFRTFAEMEAACQVPDSILVVMSTRDLVATCLTHPLLGVYALSYGLDRALVEAQERFNGMRMLMVRPDALIELIEYYAHSDRILQEAFVHDESADAVRVFDASIGRPMFVEAVLSSPASLGSMTRNEKAQAVAAIVTKYEQLVEVLGQVELSRTATYGSMERCLVSLLLDVGALRIDGHKSSVTTYEPASEPTSENEILEAMDNLLSAARDFAGEQAMSVEREDR